MFSKLKAELDAVMARDPAARSRAEVYFLYSGTVAITSVFMNPLFYPHYPHSPQPLILQRLYSKMFFSFFFSYAIICGAANIYTYTFRILSKEGFLHG